MKTPLQKPRMQPLAKHQTSPPSWHVLTLLTFGPRDLEENRCLNPCTLITYLVTDPISSLGQLNELPVKCQTSAFICTLLFVYFGIKPRFFNITWHELQLGCKWSRLKAWNFPGATTLTQQLVKMMHFLSPRPPPGSVFTLWLQIFFNTINIAEGKGGQQKQALSTTFPSIYNRLNTLLISKVCFRASFS